MWKKLDERKKERHREIKLEREGERSWEKEKYNSLREMLVLVCAQSNQKSNPNAEKNILKCIFHRESNRREESKYLECKK